jgi:hypothetical protein
MLDIQLRIQQRIHHIHMLEQLERQLLKRRQ